MADITGNFNKNMPSGTSRKSDGDDLMRQHWGALGSTWTEEHHFTDSTASAGLHKRGSARAYVASTASASGADRDGKIWLDSVNSDIYLLRDSGRTNLLAPRPSRQIVHRSFISTVAPVATSQLMTLAFKRKFTSNTNQNRPYFGIVFDDVPTIIAQAETSAILTEGQVTVTNPTVSAASFLCVATSDGATRLSNWTLHALITGFVSNFS